jgi:hypothetical protein
VGTCSYPLGWRKAVRQAKVPQMVPRDGSSCRLLYTSSQPHIWQQAMLQVELVKPGVKCSSLPSGLPLCCHGSKCVSGVQLICNCRFEGSLPESWANPLSFKQLRTMDLTQNKLSGVLPQWNVQGAFPSLQVLRLGRNNFVGASCGGHSARVALAAPPAAAHSKPGPYSCLRESRISPTM